MLLWTFVYKFLQEHTFSFFLGRQLGIVYLRKIFQSIFQSGSTILHLSPAMYEGCNFSTFSMTFGFVCLFDYGYSSEQEMVSHYGLSLHFPNDA